MELRKGLQEAMPELESMDMLPPMGDSQVRCPVANHFDPLHGLRERLHGSIFQLLQVNLGDAGFLIYLHLEEVEAVMESVTARTKKGAGRKTTLYVGQPMWPPSCSRQRRLQKMLVSPSQPMLEPV